MKPQDIIELEKKIEARTLDQSNIDNKSHPAFGAVLTKKTALIALISAIVAAGGLLTLNAMNFMGIQSATGLLGSSSWGNIFGNGAGYMFKGLASVICETASYGAVLGSAVLVPNTIRGITNYRKYKKMLEPNLTKEQKEKIAEKELEYEAAVTENLINKVNGRTHARSSAYAKAYDARRAMTQTKNPFKKAKLAIEAKLNEDLVNKSIKTLIERLNTLSIQKNNEWIYTGVNKQGLLVKKKYTADEILRKNDEMRMIQAFLAEILDNSAKTDPYYACLKHYLKKYHKTIELVNLPSDKPEVAEELKNDITDNVVSGNIAEAIKNFCTYSPYIIAKGKKTSLTETTDINDILVSKWEAELEARKSEERIRTIELNMNTILQNAKEVELALQGYAIKGEGSAKRLEKHEKTFTKKIGTAHDLILEAQSIINDLTQIKNNFILEYDAIVDRSKLSKVHAKEIKSILKNSIKDRTEIKNAKKQIKDLLKAAKAENLFTDLERLIDYAFLSEQHIAVIEANLKESNKIKGRAGNALGETRTSARIAHTAAEDAKESAEIAKKSAESAGKSAQDAENEKKKSSNAKRFTEGQATTAALITSMMERDRKAQKEKGDELIKYFEDKKNEVEKLITDVRKIIALLKSTKSQDIITIKQNYITIIKKLSAVSNLEVSINKHEDRMDEIAEMMITSFDDIYTYLKKINMPDYADVIETLKNEINAIKERVSATEETQQSHSKQISKLSEQFISLVEDVKRLNTYVQGHTSLIKILNSGYFTINTEIKNRFKTLVNLAINNSKNQQKLEEFACWTQHDIDELKLVVEQLESHVAELQSQPSAKEDEEETIKTEKFNFPMSENLKTQIKLYKNFTHAIHQALNDKQPLPTTAPNSMKGKKRTQEEIASVGGKNMDFSSKGLFSQEVLEICEKYLNKKEFAFVKRVMDIVLSKQEESDLEALIGLIEKACTNYNNKNFGVGI